MNPRKRLFEGLGSPVGGTGGIDIVLPGSALWKTWCRHLRGASDPLRFALLGKSIGDIHRALVECGD